MKLNGLIVTSFYYYHKKAIVELWLSVFLIFIGVYVLLLQFAIDAYGNPLSVSLWFYQYRKHRKHHAHSLAIPLLLWLKASHMHGI